MVLGKRKNLKSIMPHRITITVLGAGLLWFGWFGFNAGSALTINSVAMNAFITTNTSAAAAAIGWVICEWIHNKKPTVLGTASGAVAGLVAITPGAGFVTPMASILIGLIGGMICFFAVAIMKKKFGYDDALDAFGCHGIGGTWGGIATGIFASKAVNSAGADGLLLGNPHLLGVQIISIIATIAFAAVMTFIILKVIGLFMTIRVTEEEEHIGLDVSEHSEEAYSGINM
jgi:Amt family ammonium transporter